MICYKMKVPNWRETGSAVDRQAGLFAALMEARLDTIGTCFHGKSNLNLNEFKKCAKKAVQLYKRRLW